MSRSSLRAVGIAAFTASLLLAACSRSPTASPGKSGAASAEEKQACIEQATAAVTAARQPLKVVGPPSPIDMSKNAGKSVWLISAVQTEFTQTVATGFTAAARAAGLVPKYVQASGQVNQMQQLVDQAISAKAAGIALLNIQPSTVSRSLDAARAAGITVIDLNNGNPADPVPAGVFAHVAAEFSGTGKMTADWLLMDSGCELHLATFTVPTLAVVELMIKGSIAEVKRLCPTACTVTESEFNLATFANTLGPQAQTVIRRDPKINYIYPAADAFAAVISPVLQQTGSKVKITGSDGNPSTLKAMAAGTTLQAMTVAYAPEQYIGWALIDQLGRGMLGVEPANWALPGRIIDSTNIGTASESDIHPGYENFDELFTNAWGR